MKERSIAIDVFGRPAHSDLGEDTIVRVGAREVRKRLAQYYVTDEGAASDIRIDLVPGSYAPEFRYVHQEKIDAIAPEVEQKPSVHQSSKGRTLRIAVAVALALGTVVVLAKWPKSDPASQLARTFWEPVYASAEPLLLAVSNPIVYHPSERAVQLSEKFLPPQTTPIQRAIQVPPGKLDGSDMVPVFNQYVGFGDMVAASEISSMLARAGKAVRIRLASNISFADMRQAPTVLIGAFTNRWTMELGESWKFQFGRLPDRRSMIFEADPKGPAKQWWIPLNADGSSEEDYLMICRVRNSSSGGFLLAAAGLKQFGTEAGGRLLTDFPQLGIALGRLPAGWESRNLQVVLHLRVIGNVPAQPEVVAYRIW